MDSPSAVARRARRGWSAALVLGAVCLVHASGSATSPQGNRAAPQPTAAAPAIAPKALVDRYCVGCHSERRKTGGLVLEHRDMAHVGVDAEIWEKVVKKLQAGAMPPVGSPRPDKKTYQALLKTLEESLDRAAQAAPDPGRPPVHRLNRLEYTNAIRDLFGFDIDGKTMLPADDSGFGFDNIADVLTVSPALMDRYLLAANKISRLAVGDPTIRPGVTTYDVGDVTLGQDDRMSEQLPFGSRGGAAIRHYFPLDGEYRVKFALQHSDVALTYAIRGLDVKNDIDVRVDRKRVNLFTIGGPDPKLSFAYGDFVGYTTEEYAPDAAAEARFVVKAGTHIVGLSFNKDTFNVDGGGVSRLPLTSSGFNQGNNTSAANGRIEMTIQKIMIAGPFDGTRPVDSPQYRRLFVCQPKNAAEEEPCARRILSAVAGRAYRRPATDADLRVLMPFYQRGRTGTTFESGIQAALTRMLVDINFLFRIEKDPPTVTPGSPYRLTDFELASRLSFFLWSSIPDDELLRVAASGTLREPAVIERQVKRMLADPRANVMISNFFGQWLYVRNITTQRPDKNLFPEFDENLRLAFEQETRLFLESQIRDDRPTSELLSANYTFVNERLARHYGIPDIIGSHFRRVDLPAHLQRNGLLGQGSILTVTSYADRTSVVLRGKYILQNLLGIPPPPPPPDVPPLADTVIHGSLRQRMELHRKSPVCSSCHAMIDPLGFALENFDGIGKYRTVDGTTPVDASGALVNGTAFNDPTSFREALLSLQPALQGTLVEKLMTYAVGRGVEATDMPAVRQVIRNAAGANNRWSAVILEVVKSAPFQARRAES